MAPAVVVTSESTVEYSVLRIAQYRSAHLFTTRASGTTRRGGWAMIYRAGNDYVQARIDNQLK